MARRLLAWLAIGFGACLFGIGLLAMLQVIQMPATLALPGSPTQTLADQGLVAFLGAGILWVGALRLMRPRTASHD